MAAPTTKKFGQLTIYLENPATPGVWTAPCGFTSKAFELSKDLTDVVIPDCADPDLVAYVGREVRSLSWSVTGDGVLALESLTSWRSFADATTAWGIRVDIDGAAGSGSGVWEGKAHLESFSISGDLGEKLQVEVSIQGDGALTFTAD